MYGEDNEAFYSRFGGLAEAFRASFGRLPQRFFSSPGRVEIVGNHTDRQRGKVLVSTISCDMIAAVEPRGDDMVEIVAESFSPIRFSLSDTAMREREKGKPIALARGVLRDLMDGGYRFGGFNAYLRSNIFRGAGSSAAFEVLVAEIVNALYLGGRLTAAEKTHAGMFAENLYFGKPCGLLDQYAIALGGSNEIDFKDRTVVRHVPPLNGYRLVITDAGGSREKPTAHDSEICREMGDVAAVFHRTALSGLTREEILSDLPQLRASVSDRAIIRALHFFDECERVERASDALERGDRDDFLRQVRMSGESSLKYLQNCAVAGDSSQPVVLALNLSERILKHGAYRVMGGGFAGSVLAFCPDSETEEYEREMARVFGKKNVFRAQLSEFGATELNGA